jgi:prepilin-type N-terminal cleavage/methylation domain-containing protein
MSTRAPMPPRRRDGFTLVEVLVVVSVIILLLGILFPAFTAIRRSQKVKRAEATLEALCSGIDAYQNDYGVYPPAAFVAGLNCGNRSLVVLLNVKGGRSAPYLPSAFYDGAEIVGPLFLDEWERPFIYFDTSAMTGAVHTYGYGIGGVSAAAPAGTTDFYNFGRFQLWSCGPNGRDDGGRGLGTEGADDIANFAVRD